MIGKYMKKITRYKRLKLTHYKENEKNARKNMTKIPFYGKIILL